MMNADKLVIQLGKSYRVHGEEVSEFVLREPKAKELRKYGMNMKSIAEVLDLAGELSGWPASAMDELSMSDVVKIMEEFGCFLERLLPDGIVGKPSS